MLSERKKLQTPRSDSPDARIVTEIYWTEGDKQLTEAAVSGPQYVQRLYWNDLRSLCIFKGPFLPRIKNQNQGHKAATAGSTVSYPFSPAQQSLIPRQPSFYFIAFFFQLKGQTRIGCNARRVRSRQHHRIQTLTLTNKFVRSSASSRHRLFLVNRPKSLVSRDSRPVFNTRGAHCAGCTRRGLHTLASSSFEVHLSREKPVS